MYDLIIKAGRLVDPIQDIDGGPNPMDSMWPGHSTAPLR